MFYLNNPIFHLRFVNKQMTADEGFIADNASNAASKLYNATLVSHEPNVTAG